MEVLDLKKLHNTLCTITSILHRLEEKESRYYDIFRTGSRFTVNPFFDRFITEHYFSFPVDIITHEFLNTIQVTERIFPNRGASYERRVWIPIQILSFSHEMLEKWVKDEIELYKAEELEKEEQKLKRTLINLKNDLLQTMQGGLSVTDIVELVNTSTEKEVEKIVKKLEDERNKSELNTGNDDLIIYDIEI